MRTSKIFDLAEKINSALKKAEFPRLSKIEYDLLMHRVRNLYEELEALNNPAKEAVAEISKNENTVAPEIVLPDETVLNKVTIEKEVIIKKEESKPKLNSLNESISTLQSLNEKLKSSSKGVHKKLASKPLKDLIDLNKRFVFNNELFKGNSEAFASSVQNLDAAENYGAAELYIRKELIPNYNWEESSPTVRLFMNLVKQRFGVH